MIDQSVIGASNYGLAKYKDAQGTDYIVLDKVLKNPSGVDLPNFGVSSILRSSLISTHQASVTHVSHLEALGWKTVTDCRFDPG